MAVSQYTIWLSRKTLTRKTWSKAAITTFAFHSRIHCSLHQSIPLQTPQHTLWTDNLIVYKSKMQYMRGQISCQLERWMPPSRYSGRKTITIESRCQSLKAGLWCQWILMCCASWVGTSEEGWLCAVPCDQGTQVSPDPGRVWASETYWLALVARPAADLWLSSEALVLNDSSPARHRRDKGSNVVIPESPWGVVGRHWLKKNIRDKMNRERLSGIQITHWADNSIGLVMISVGASPVGRV